MTTTAYRQSGPTGTAALALAAPALCDRTAVAVLALVAAIAALTFRDYGLGWDDYTHAQYGDLLLKLYGSGFADRRALSFVNLYAYGGGFDMASALAAKVLPFDLFETRRLCGAVLGIVGLAVTWRIGRRLGGPPAGLLALVLLAACPLYYGHMFMNAKDGPFAVAMTVLLLGLVRVFASYPRPSVADVAVFALGLGLAMGSRILGGLAAFYALGAVLLIVGSETRSLGAGAAGRRLGAFMFTLVPAFLVAYAVMALTWPWSVEAPLNPFGAAVYFSHFFEKPWRELFAGVLIPVPDMPRIYVPQLFALKLPEILLVLGIGGTVGALIAAARAELPLRRRAVLLLIALAAILPVAIAVATRPAMYNGVRHFVFITPPLAVLGGLAGGWIVARLGAYSRAFGALAAAAIALALLPPIADMVRLHPYEYVDFNRFAGGVGAARSRYMLDYWGLSFKQAAMEFHEKLAESATPPPADRPWRMAVCGPHPPAQVALGPQFSISWNPAGADFAMTLGEFYCRKLDAPVVVEIARDGVVFARVYDLRGKSFTNLLTIPAP